MVSILVSLIVAGIAGWLTCKLMNMDGNIVLNVFLGILGGTVGSILLSLVGIHGSGFLGNIIVAVIGSCIVVWLVNKIKR